MMTGVMPPVMAAGCVFPNPHLPVPAMRPVFVFAKVSPLRMLFVLPAANLVLLFVTFFVLPAFFPIAEKIIKCAPIRIQRGKRSANTPVWGSTIAANLFAPALPSARIFQKQLFHFLPMSG
jgi:hypothetical protein